MTFTYYVGVSLLGQPQYVVHTLTPETIRYQDTKSSFENQSRRKQRGRRNGDYYKNHK